MKRLVVLMMVLVLAPTLAAQGGNVPVPRPFPGAPTPPSTTAPRPPAEPAVEAPPPPVQTTTAPTAATSGPDLPGVPVYPTAEYLDTIDAGMGQNYYLYGSDLPFSEIVSYYRTVLRSGGREIYRTPGMHQFDLGRFNDGQMAYPPSVVVKDYADGASSGYLHVDGTSERRFRTVIQIVPPGPQ